MSYQNVGTPRFYVDTISWLKAIGVIKAIRDGINPTDIQERTWSDGTGFNCYYIDLIGTKIPKWTKLNYWATLGHNLKGVHHIPHFHKIADGDSAEQYDQCQPNHTEIVNAGGASNTKWFTPENDGFTITEMSGSNNFSSLGNNKDLNSIYLWSNDTTGLDNSSITLPFTSKIGAVSIGEFYDMPHSPDLSLKLSFEYDGVKTIQTRGGATLSNATYIKPADWGDGGAWQLGSDDNGNPIDNLRSGRRVFDLSFSYISDSDLMPKVAATTNLGSGDNEYIDPATNTAYENSLLDSSDFFSQVWNRTLGGHLPFIFNPNGGGSSPNNNPDQFAICRFDMNTLTYDQVANNVYNVKLKIREVW